MNESFPDITGQYVQPHFESVGNSKFAEGPFNKTDEIGSDLTDARVSLRVLTSALSSPLQSYMVAPHQCIVRWGSPLG